MKSSSGALASVALAVCAGLAAPSALADVALARELLRELVEIRTVHPDGDNTAAARAMARRLLDAGFDPKDVEVIEPAPRKGNLVARLRGTGELKPVLLLAHLDVVEAKKEDWSDGLDPFRLTERDGYLYGRGTLDDKAMAAIFVANLVRYRREGLRPKRDIIVALTADEETGTHNGVTLLLKGRREAIEAEFALNEGAGGVLRSGKPFALGVQVSEKMYLSFDFESANAGGHSSQPRRDNAIYDLAGALDRLARLELPARMNATNRGYFGTMAAMEGGALGEALAAMAAGRASAAQERLVSADPRFNAQVRTTCVATRIEGGHADNALAQRARATVNCRLVPQEEPEYVRAELQRVAGDRVTVRARGNVRRSEPSDPDSAVVSTIRRVAATLWPGTPVMPVMGSGATDGSRLRNAGIPVYGVSGIFVEHGEGRIHGRDERVGVRAFSDGNEFLFRLVKALALGE